MTTKLEGEWEWQLSSNSSASMLAAAPGVYSVYKVYKGRGLCLSGRTTKKELFCSFPTITKKLKIHFIKELPADVAQ